jgi:hypothetical protein
MKGLAMAIRYDHYWRLEPSPRQYDLATGFSAAVHDPVWFLARQWQLGEMQGESASSPVLTEYTLTTTALAPASQDPTEDPTLVPAEVIVEAEPDSWWTMGRRLRIGAAIVADNHLTLNDLPSNCRFGTPTTPDRAPAPPYDRFLGAADGLGLWRTADTLGLPAAAFATFDIPAQRETCWDSAELVYDATFPLAGAPESGLRLPRHRGGAVDWFSADATAAGEVPAHATVRTVFPAPLQYPGAPHSRWWEIEDAAVDVGGYPPDPSHFATSLLIELIASHSDDWFLFPVDAPVANILTLDKVTVTDSFGDTYDVHAPKDWWLFRIAGFGASTLALWLRTITPIEGPPLEDVLLGIDEYANLLWAVEQRVDGRDTSPPAQDPDHELANPTVAQPQTVIDSAASAYTYVPAIGTAAHWHPYELDDTPSRRFVQRRLADLSRAQPELLPAPVAEVLRAYSGNTEIIHQIEPATVPSIGTHLQRRYQLARSITGDPCLWVQRQRTPVLRPPSRTARFDHLAPDNRSP